MALTVRRIFLLIARAAPSVGGRAVQFVALTLLAAVLAPARYGEFAVLQALIVGVASIVSSTTAAAINCATARDVVHHRSGVLAVVIGTLRGRRKLFLVNAVVSACLVPIGFVVISGTSPSTTQIVVVVLIGAAGGALPMGEVLVAVLAGQRRYRASTSVDAVRSVLQAASIVAGGFFLGAIGAAAGLVVLDVLFVCVLLLAAVIRPRPLPDFTVSDRASNGLGAGIGANVIGLSAGWIVMFGVQTVAGASGLGAYAVGARFASLLSLVPTYLGKTVIGQFAAPHPTEHNWTPRGFVSVVAVLSVVGSGVAYAVYRFAFPQLRESYEMLDSIVAVSLAAMVFRSLVITGGQICIARRQWNLMLWTDVVILLVTVMGIVSTLAIGAPVQVVIGVAAVSAAVGAAMRLGGLHRVSSRMVAEA
jgi:hypothetical protein